MKESSTFVFGLEVCYYAFANGFCLAAEDHRARQGHG